MIFLAGAAVAVAAAACAASLSLLFWSLRAQAAERRDTADRFQELVGQVHFYQRPAPERPTPTAPGPVDPWDEPEVVSDVEDQLRASGVLMDDVARLDVG